MSVMILYNILMCPTMNALIKTFPKTVLFTCVFSCVHGNVTSRKYDAQTFVSGTLSDALTNANIKTNWLFLCVWLLFRVLYTSLFIAAARDKKWPVLSSAPNDTNSSTGITPICTSQDVAEDIEHQSKNVIRNIANRDANSLSRAISLLDCLGFCNQFWNITKY